MKLLLDTHIWLWSHLDPDHLASPIVQALRDEGNELWLSPVSVWESILLIEKGKVEVDSEPEAWIRDALESAPMKEATLNHEVAFRSRTIDLPHRDTADRFLAATAEVYALMLVTEDHRLLTGVSWPVLSFGETEES